ncbi:MAG: hypothetical protein ACYCTF_12345 [Acidiferrobacter sp.]
MLRFRHSPRMLLAAWIAFMGLWPLQAAAYQAGPQRTAVCQMMPRIASMAGMSKSSHGVVSGMNACRQLQCHHRLGPHVAAAVMVHPLLPMRYLSPATVSLAGGAAWPVSRPAARAPPAFLRFARLLI